MRPSTDNELPLARIYDRLARLDRTVRLTPDERRLAELTIAGETNVQIANRLGRSPRTVDSALREAFKKLGVRSRAELIAKLSRPTERPSSSSALARGRAAAVRAGSDGARAGPAPAADAPAKSGTRDVGGRAVDSSTTEEET